MDDAGSVYNSEANLIWASREGNQLKRDMRYTLNQLADTYLEVQFGTKDREAITREIEQTVNGIPVNAPFTELSETQQRALRHALFLDSQSPAFQAAFQRLATRHKNRVNGTQAWLARSVMTQLDRMLTEKGCQLEAHVLRVTAEDAHRIREMLANHDPALQKQEMQGATSHAIDALCAQAAAISQQPGLFETSPELAEDPEWLAGCLPQIFRIQRIEALKPYSPKKDLSGVPLFKESIYAENFLPIWVGQNQIRIGFDWCDAITVTGKAPEQFLQILWPWLSVEEAQTPEALMATETPCCLKVKKRKALDRLHEAWHKPLEETEFKAAQVLESLRYCTARKEVRQVLWSQNKPSGFAKQPNDPKFRKKFSVRVKAPSRFPFKYDGNQSLPVWHDWMRVLRDPELKQALEHNQEPDWLKVGERLFRPGSARPHRKSRRVYSLPVIDNPSGGVRIRRKTPEGDIFQLIATNFKVTAFSIENNRIVLSKPVYGPHVKAKNASLPGEFHKQPSPGTVALDQWLEIPLTDSEKETFLSLYIAPASERRSRIIAKQSPDQFFSLWGELLPGNYLASTGAENRRESYNIHKLPSLLKMQVTDAQKGTLLPALAPALPPRMESGKFKLELHEAGNRFVYEYEATQINNQREALIARALSSGYKA